MKTLKLVLCAGVASMGLAFAGLASAQTAPAPAAAPAAPAASPAPYPAMSATLAANPNPISFDAGPLGKLTVTGVLSGGGFYQDTPQYNYLGFQNNKGYGDLTNGLVMVQKTDGPVQFFVAAGAYSLAQVGAPYLPASVQANATFGYIPEGFVKIVPDSKWSIMAGLLPTLVGDEYTFTFQNMNIQRGLLWGQENVFTKGVQVNYASGPLSLSLSWNDGFDSNVFNTVSAFASYAFSGSDTLAFAASAATGTVGFQGFFKQAVTPVFQSNSQIYNLIYTHTKGPWVISPYFQYTNVPSNSATQFAQTNFVFLPGNGAGHTIGGALLVKYSFTPEFNLAFRGEYVASGGSASLLYGPGSSAYSLTLTPTYQKGIFFIRGEVSYTGITSGTPGFMFGTNFNKSGQTRVAGEAGIMF